MRLSLAVALMAFLPVSGHSLTLIGENAKKGVIVSVGEHEIRLRNDNGVLDVSTNVPLILGDGVFISRNSVDVIPVWRAEFSKCSSGYCEASAPFSPEMIGEAENPIIAMRGIDGDVVFTKFPEGVWR